MPQVSVRPYPQRCMLDPRIYRAAFLPVLLRASWSRLLAGGPSAARSATTLAPDAFDGAAGVRDARRRWPRAFPDAPPGRRRRRRRSPRRVAERRSARARASRCGTRRFDGARRSTASSDLTTVVGERAGQLGRADRRRRPPRRAGRGARAELSGTAALLELARVFGGRAGRADARRSSRRAAAAAARRARASWPSDLPAARSTRCSSSATSPARACAGRSSSPWSTARRARAAAAAAHGRGGGARGDRRRRRRGRARRAVARLAFPLTLGEQGPLGARGPAGGAAVGQRRARAGRRRAGRRATRLERLRPRGAAHDHRARQRAAAVGATAPTRDLVTRAQGAARVGGAAARRRAAAAGAARGGRRLRARAPPPRAGRRVAALDRSPRRAAVRARARCSRCFLGVTGLLAGRARRRRSRPGRCPSTGAAALRRRRRSSLVLGWVGARARALAARPRALRRRSAAARRGGRAGHAGALSAGDRRVGREPVRRGAARARAAPVAARRRARGPAAPRRRRWPWSRSALAAGRARRRSSIAGSSASAPVEAAVERCSLLVAGGQVVGAAALLAVARCSRGCALRALAARRRARRGARTPDEPPITVRGPRQLRGPGLAGRHRVRPAPMTRDAPRRCAASRRVLIVAGVLLLVDAGLTLAWQEPVSALFAQLAPGPPRRRPARARAARGRRRCERRGAGAARRPSAGGWPSWRARSAPRGPTATPSAASASRDRRDYVVVDGTDPATLRKGPGIYADTPLPGAPGTTAIAGHRTTYLARRSAHIDELERGDRSSSRCPTGASPTRSSARGSWQPDGGLGDRARVATTGSC